MDILKAYLIYTLSMDYSPSWEVILCTTDKETAENTLLKTRLEQEYDDEETDSWKQVDMQEVKVLDAKRGDTLHVLMQVKWTDHVTAFPSVFLNPEHAKIQLRLWKKNAKAMNPLITPFNEDESFEESMHLHDESGMLDLFYDIIPVTIQ